MSQDEQTGCVLVIDDDDNIRTLLERQVRRLGYEVLQASDGLTGLAIAATGKPQVILVDLRMPGIDGHTFLRRLTSAGIQASVVAMSGQGNMDDVIDVLRAGVIDYLRKPWSVADLTAAIARGFERQQHLAPGRPVTDAPPPPAVTGAPPPPPPPPARDGKLDALPQFLTRLRSGELPIPAGPAVVMSLRAEVQRPDVDLDQLAALIERDQRLTSDVLRLANTAHYARGARIHGIRMAVSRIGLRQLHNLVETVFLRDFFKARDPEVGRLLGQLWQRSVLHAVAMRELAPLAIGASGRLNGDMAYFVGLMSDVGASLLLWMADERRAAGVTSSGASSHLAAIVVSHQEVGAALLGRWLVDRAVVDAVAEHHPQATAKFGDYSRMMVVVADLVGGIAGVPPDLTAPAPPAPALVDRCVAELQLDRRQVAALASTLAERYRETLEACR